MNIHLPKKTDVKVKKHPFPSVLQIITVILIIFLAGCDFFSMFDAFTQMDGTPQESAAYAVTIVCFLEGLPIYLGIIFAERSDDTRYKVSDKRTISVFMMILAFCTVLVAIIVAVGLRWFLINYNGGYEAFIEGNYAVNNDGDNSQFGGDILRAVLPVMTSIYAYVASRIAFRSNYYKKIKKEVDFLEKRFNAYERDFQRSYQRSKEARVSLWNSLREQEETMPDNISEYRAKCYERIRERLTSYCINAYPTQVERYSAEIESELAHYLLELSQFTTLPQTITKLDIKDIIQKYDASVINEVDCWNYDKSGEHLATEMRVTLEEAIVATQFNLN